MTISSRLVRVTPAMAEKWLEGNCLNRVISDAWVRYLATQMKRGMWTPTGDTLKFASDATLLDGQHRLWACFHSKVPFTTLVAEGIDKSVFPNIDTGKGRSPGDVINIAGMKQNSALIAQAATHVLNYQTGDVNSFRKRICRADVLQFAQDNSKLLELVTLARHTKGGTVRKHAATVIAVAYMGGHKYDQQARNYLRKFMTGEELTAKNPILVLRNRLLAENNLRTYERLAMAANSWNAYVAGKQISHLKITGTAFPKIAGAK